MHFAPHSDTVLLSAHGQKEQESMKSEHKKEGHWRQPVTFKVGSSKGKPLTISRNSIVSDFPTHFKNERGI